MTVTDLAPDAAPLPLPESRPGAAPSRRAVSIGTRAALLVLAYVIVTGGLLATLLVQLRTEAIGASNRELAAFAQLTAGHTFEVALGLEDALKLTDVTLSMATDAGAVDPEQIRAMLRDVIANARALKDIVVLDARGRVVYQGAGRAEIGRDWSDRPYFTRFQKDAALSFGFGSAFAAGAGDWQIPVAHAWRRSNGQFLGVIVGMIDRQLFDKVWTFDAEIAGLSIALAAADGSVITRRPFAGAAVRPVIDDREILSALAQDRPADTLQVTDAADGRVRLVAYRRVAGYPGLVILVAQPRDVVLANWWRVVAVAGSSWLLASLALGALGLWLAREMKARGILESRYRALFNSIPYPVIVSEAGGTRILASNDATGRQYGWPAADPDVHLPDDFAVLAARRHDFSPDTATVIAEQRHRNREGAAIDVELTVRQIEYGGGPAHLTVAVDVSDRLRAERARRAAEDQLRQSQKMDVLGQLTGGIAHDFNNILMVIIDNVETLAEAPGVDAEMRRGLDRIADSAQRAEDLTRQMLAFSRKQPLRPRPTDVNDLVADTGKLLRRTLGEQIEIDSILADDVWTVDVDPVQLGTSLVNLCLNARDAMPGGGHVLIETQNVTVDAAHPAPDAAVPPGDYVRIAVSDTGHGILPADIDRIFDPFFTTKAAGKGSGLGLSMVYGFIRQSNGHVGVSSEIDRGTSFRLYLPRHAGAAGAAAAPQPAVAVGGSERVLVVEDDAQVRASVVRQLLSLGYTVESAEDGAAGLAAFEAAARPYALLLTDVIMPGPLNGKALADEVARRWPATAIVFMSGYTDNALVHRGEIDAGVRLLNKPFRKRDLAQILRQALDGQPHA
ncbi:MAG: response regulator [Proteobacteria bacterium]|nr:response regulator [Pseudomonadota bacterium]